MWRKVSRRAGALVLAVLLAAAFPAASRADYVDPQGNTVHWAGGDDIVVTDPAGNVIYQGAGVRREDGRLVMPGQDAGYYGAVPAYDPLAAGPIGLGGDSGTSRATTGGSSPYANTVYGGMQPVTLNAGGQALSGYANVYLGPPDPETGVMLGYSAVPASSEIGRLLASAGFQVQGGLVLIHFGAAGAEVAWEATQTLGPSFVNVSTAFPELVGGGAILITIPTVPPPPPPEWPVDVRALYADLQQPVVPVGRSVLVAACVVGQTASVSAFALWGTAVPLERYPDGWWRAVLPVPINVRPGVYPVVFEADISQPPGFGPKRFEVVRMLSVVAAADVPAPEATPEDDFDDWWTPPWYRW